MSIPRYFLNPELTKSDLYYVLLNIVKPNNKFFPQFHRTKCAISVNKNEVI